MRSEFALTLSFGYSNKLLKFCKKKFNEKIESYSLSKMPLLHGKILLFFVWFNESNATLKGTGN